MSILNVLYKKTSINLQVVGGFVMLGIFVNINQLYEIVPKEYSGGILVVFMIGISKYFDLILGNNNAIIFTRQTRFSLFKRTNTFAHLLPPIRICNYSSPFIMI